MLLKIERGFDKFADFIGAITSIAMILMVLNVFYDVIMRYFFKTGSIAMQEMEWHLFSVIILLGIAYTLKEDGHVRVDLVYDRLSPKKKAMINMIGAVLFILPIAILIITSSIGFAYESFDSHEISGDPGGLTNRWIVKALIPLSFSLLIITTVGFFIKNLNAYRGAHPIQDWSVKDDMDHLKDEFNEHKHHIIDIDEKGDNK